MPRILLWTDSFLPYIGGVEVLASRYVRAMSERGYEFVIVTRRDGDALPERDTFEGSPLYRLDVRAALLANDPRELLRLRRMFAGLVTEFQPDLLHIYHLGTGAMLFDGVRSLPRVLTLHSHLLPEHVRPRTATGTLIEGVDEIVCCSQSMADNVCESRPEFAGRMRVILNALDMPALLPEPLPFDPPRLLALGRLTTVKGFDVAIDAFAQLHERFPALRMTIAGDGPTCADLARQIAAHGLQEQIEMLGWVAPESVPALMNTHTIVLMPSRYPEPFGLVALQAAQMARPIVASRVGGIPEVVEDEVSGLLVPPDDPEALAAATMSLLEQPERATQMGLRGHERARERFTWDAHLQSYDDLMRELLDRKV